MKKIEIETVKIKPLKFQVCTFEIRSTSEYVSNKFSNRIRLLIEGKHRLGSQAAVKDKKKEARDFEMQFREAQYRSKAGWYGVPAAAFRSALIRACSLSGFKMTIAKMSVWVEADGVDHEDGKPIVKLVCKPPVQRITPVRNASGVMDLRSRPHYPEWKTKLRLRYDADQFSTTDIANLLVRAGAQVGVGEGRHDSPNSDGMGWGCFEVVMKKGRAT